MIQERGLGDLSAEDIARRIGAAPAGRAKSIGERLGAIRVLPPEPVRASPQAVTVSPIRIGTQRPEQRSQEPVRHPAPLASAFPMRIATQRSEPGPVKPATDLPPLNPAPPWVIDLPGPRRRLIRDTAATLAGLSAVVLIVLAVMPPSHDGGVLGVTGSPAVAAESASTSQTGSMEPTALPTPGPSPTPDPTTATPRP